MTTHLGPHLTVTLNGISTQIPDGARVSDVVALALKGASTDGIAVAIDAVVVPRSNWGAFTISEGAVIELVTATQGG